MQEPKRETLRNHSYALYIVNASGERECILEAVPAQRIRRVALSIKERPDRRVIITRNQKDLPGGARALDNELYQIWLEDHSGDLKP